MAYILVGIMFSDELIYCAEVLPPVLRNGGLLRLKEGSMNRLFIVDIDVLGERNPTVTVV
jgi:hypothetical protein